MKRQWLRIQLRSDLTLVRKDTRPWRGRTASRWYSVTDFATYHLPRYRYPAHIPCTLWTVERWQYIFQHNDFYNFCTVVTKKKFVTHVWKNVHLTPISYLCSLWKWNITFHTFIMHSYNKSTSCIKHGVQHKVHQIQRKQINSHKVCRKCPPGRQMCMSRFYRATCNADAV